MRLNGAIICIGWGIILQSKRFASAFRAWERKIWKGIEKSKLTPEWIPQMNAATGETYYLNLNTGTTHEEHPNAPKARKTVQEEWTRGERQLAKRFSALEDYK